jgi:hypothetical protein
LIAVRENGFAELGEGMSVSISRESALKKKWPGRAISRYQHCRRSIAAAEVPDDDLVAPALPDRDILAAFSQAFSQGLASFAVTAHFAFALRAVCSALSQAAFHAAKITAHTDRWLRIGFRRCGKSR